MWRLLRKDFIAHRGALAVLAAIYLLLALLFLLIEQRFHPLLILAFLIPFLDVYLRNEPRGEALMLSLPLDRRRMVFSRYVTAAMFLLLTLAVTYLAALLARVLLGRLAADPLNVLSFGDLVLTASLYAMCVSASLPSFFRMGYPGYPTGLIISTASTILIWGVFAGALHAAVSLTGPGWSLALAGEGPRGIERLVEVFSAIIARAAGQWGWPATWLFFAAFAVACLLASMGLGIAFYRRRDIRVSEPDAEAA